MEIQLSHPSGSSPSSSSSAPNPNPNLNPNSMQSWWESISKARSRIQSLSTILPSTTISSLADSDRPARSLLESPTAYLTLSSSLSSPISGTGSDPLCNWLYDTFQSSDPDLRLVVLSFLPLLSGLYLSRISSPNPPSLAGFEAVLLAIYSSECKTRAGKPLLISVPDLSQPSLYHAPKYNKTLVSNSHAVAPSVSMISAPLEPQIAVKSTKRGCIVAVTLDCYYKKISLMPSHSKLDLCEFAAAWAGQDCSCSKEIDGESEGNANLEIRVLEGNEDKTGGVEEEMGRLKIGERRSPNRANGHCREESRVFESRVSECRVSRGARIPFPWELFQPVLTILAHCLLAPLNPQEVRDAAAVAVRHLYARALHDLIPQAILATRSLIQLDKRARIAAKAAAAAANAASNANPSNKPKRPEILLVSK
ncbi:uncharacterized protein LOC143890995 [Tasmannia lanceolata]|uniref:uncharacterized protein LOC143890995 n=1 Tax=Tasmannia lanceolata TaxID=3420 RepID=UPI00406493DB